MVIRDYTLTFGVTYVLPRCTCQISTGIVDFDGADDNFPRDIYFTLETHYVAHSRIVSSLIAYMRTHAENSDESAENAVLSEERTRWTIDRYRSDPMTDLESESFTVRLSLIFIDRHAFARERGQLF